MALHRLTQIVMGVPNLEQTAAYYAEFGLTRGENGTFTTVDGGEQLRIVPAASRQPPARAARRRRRRPG
jgi:hypothetical protein